MSGTWPCTMSIMPCVNTINALSDIHPRINVPPASHATIEYRMYTMLISMNNDPRTSEARSGAIEKLVKAVIPSPKLLKKPYFGSPDTLGLGV